MNTTTIHFVQEQTNELPISNHQSTTAYSWSNLESNLNNVSLPIQQVHYVDPNLTLINNTSAKLIQMSHLEPIGNQSIAATTTTTTTITAHNNEPTYLTPLINLTLSESINYYNDNHVNNNNSTTAFSTLPSMATSFGSSIFVQQHPSSNNANMVNNSKSGKKLVKTKLNKINWNVKRKPTSGNKLNEHKLKYATETSLNSLTNKITKKTGQLQRGRKRIPKNLVQNLTTSTATLSATLSSNSTASTSNPSTTNLTSQYQQPNKHTTSVNLDNSTNSIVSTNSLYSLNSCSSLRKGKKSSNDPNDPGVKRRNLRERMRVHNLNLGYENLRAKLPNSNKKMAKVATLRCATQYIKNLLQMLNQPTSSSSSSTTFYL